MLTKECILELLGNAPEKMERWEQEVVLAKNTEEPLKYILCRLNQLKIPAKKKTLCNRLPIDTHATLKQENIDRSTYIKLQEKYKVTLTTLLCRSREGNRKMPETEVILSFYRDWVEEKGTSRGWIIAFLKKFNISHRTTLNDFLKRRNIVLFHTDSVTKEQAQYLKKLLEESHKEENFTKYCALIDYIEVNYNNRYPKRSKKSLDYLIRRIDNKCAQKFRELQDAFIQKLLDSRDVAISKSQTARCWEKLYPMRSFATYVRILSAGSLKKYMQTQNNRRKKGRKIFVEALPTSLTEEQKKQIIKAYENAYN